MKILFATYEGVQIAKGGPYIKIMEVRKHLQNMGHQVDLLNMWESFDKIKQYDVVHLVGSNFSIYGLARSLYQKGIKFIVEPVFFSRHSPLLLRTFFSLTKFLKKLVPGAWIDYIFIGDICSWAELIVPNTYAEKDLISKGFNIPGSKFEIIPNGVSERFLNADPSLFIEKYGIKDFILTVGHIGPKRKNILALVKALEKINHPSVIIGKMLNTGETQEVKELISKNKNIIHVDELPNDSPLLASAYAACDTFVLPSQFETPGIAALEAALSGAKIVITPYGGTKDYFKDMATYIEPDSIEEISEGIQKTLDSQKTDRIKEFIKNNFLWESVAKKSQQVYQQISSAK
jgi:glycosyltransferase involved in cell wall biosynthesis